MTLRIKLFISLFLLGFTSALWLTPSDGAAAQAPTTFTAKAVFDVNIRAAPGVNTGVLAVFPNGAQGSAIGRSPENNWIQLRYENTTGWVAAWVVVFSGDTWLLPVTTDIQPEPTASTTPISLSSPYNLNIRGEPNPDARIVSKMPFGGTAQALGRTSTSSWIFVDYFGTRGWVAAWLSTLSNDINGLPVVTTTIPAPTHGSGTPQATPRVTATPRATGTPAARTPTPGTPMPPLPETGLTVMGPSRVNIRSGPTATASVLKIMPYGIDVPAVGRNEGNNWIQVQYGNTVGWVAAWVVLASDNTVALPVTSPTADVAAVAPTTMITGASIYNVIIRSGPDMNYGEVGQLPANMRGTLSARTADSAWVQMTYGDVTGWVAAWVITASADMNNLRVEE